MDRSQADTVADAILAPHQKSLEERRRKREAKERDLAARRFVAAFVLAGVAIGVALAHLAGQRFIDGCLWGSLGGGAVGWAVVGWRHRRRAG